MIIVLSVIAVLAMTITTGLGFHVLRRPKQVVPDLDEISVWDKSWTWL
jgi:outer membrane lipopolysaccharide assembly protein LptE/RlpB